MQENIPMTYEIIMFVFIHVQFDMCSLLILEIDKFDSRRIKRGSFYVLNNNIMQTLILTSVGNASTKI